MREDRSYAVEEEWSSRIVLLENGAANACTDCEQLPFFGGTHDPLQLSQAEPKGLYFVTAICSLVGELQ